MVALGVLFALSRAPLLFHGYGSDDDSWRNAVAALHMHAAGRYVPSRVPGFPVYEGLLFLLAPLGAVATNAASVLAQLAGTLMLFQISRHLRIRSAGWVAAAFALVPSVWVHTTQTMDYALTLALFLAAYHQLLRSRWIYAGLLLAMAAGSRASMGLMVVPSVLFVWMSARSWRAVLKLTASFGIATAAVFLPVLLAPEVTELGAHLTRHAGGHHLRLGDVGGVGRGVAVFLFGRLGLVGMIVAVIAGLLTLRRRSVASEQAEWSASVTFEASSALITCASFVLIPYQPAYLLPALPVALLLIARIADGRALWVAALLMAAEVFVTPKIGTHRFIPGRLQEELAARDRDLQDIEGLMRQPREPRRVLVVGRPRLLRLVALALRFERLPPAWAPFATPGVALWNEGRRVGYAAALRTDDRRALAAAGYRIEDVPSDSGP
jgi:hypothetical protein